MSVVTPEMVVAYSNRFGVNAEAALGSLRMWENGRGELASSLVDAEETRELFAPLRSAYFKALGVPEPGYSAEEPKG